ncbi:hypothetical protein AUJ84_03425 [Candidatus Pacearchaeota archaeon CG1_02_32_132]|nr:MAG: hypothetical protein AUJ84_03425 [Candidatus Pacearchaeota archaeon CG1_02_32_132]
MNKNNYLTSDDILGREVIDSNGSFIGVIETLYIDKKNLRIAGIGVDKGFLRREIVIGSRYIEKITPHAVFLNIRPAYKIKGMVIYDSKGSKVGNVSSIEMAKRGNKVKNLIISKLTGNIIISSDYINKIEKSVFLNICKEKLIK